jgi:alcohol dehydrogenase class IV
LPADTFSARGHDYRLHCGAGAIEAHLATEVRRAGARRAFVVSSASVARRTDTVTRIRDALGPLCAGTFAGIEVDSTFRSVQAAAAAARAAGADLLVAAGGGSVIVATRAVDIFLCEAADPFDLMTRYPEGQPAHSPRLLAPKLPIVNIVTTPTSAMNRAGTGLANPDLDHRMEYFDPRTRPVAILWDHAALGATPADLLRSTATTTFAGALAAVAAGAANPLVEGDRAQSLALARRAFAALSARGGDAPLAARIDLCAAALLQNRAADDGGEATRGGPFGGDYAVSTALHLRYPHVRQGESTSVLTATVARLAAGAAGAHPTAPAATGATAAAGGPRRVAEALGCWRDGMTDSDACLAFADAIDGAYAAAGMPTRVGMLGIPRDDLPGIAAATVNNFNANRGVRDAAARIARSLALLEAAW